MITKDELLQKGISDEVADEIIAGLSDEGSENSLQALEKALKGETQESLFKGYGGGKKKDEDEDDDEDDDADEGEEKDYDEKYMKKHMKKYMKENKEEMEKCYGTMKKAISDIDPDSDGAVVEMSDLNPLLQSQAEMTNSMRKAIDAIAEQVALISDNSEKSYNLMQKAAAVQLEQAKGVDTYLSGSQGRRGVVSTMTKAVNPETTNEVYKALFKAVREGDRKAGEIISAFESSGKNLNALSVSAKQYIHDLITKGAN
jgi:hypothetical protein